MIITRAYKTRLRPTAEQTERLVACCDVARFVYNWAFADRQFAYENRGESIGMYEQKRRFNAWKKDHAPWVEEQPYAITEEAFRNLDAAYRNFFRRLREGAEDPGFPKFKSRFSSRQSFTVRGSIWIEPDRIKLPKIGWIDLIEHGYIPVSPKKLYFATISIRAGKWWVSVQCDVEMPDPPPNNEEVLGIDIGYGILATTSEGEQFCNVHAFARYEKKLARLQRELSRRKKGSANRAKTKAKISRLNEKIALIRGHNSHNISRAIADKPYGVIAVEQYNIQQLQKNQNKYVGQGKKFSDAGAGELRRQIKYKSDWNGKIYIPVPDSEPTNITCSACGHKQEGIGFSKEDWTCSSCATTHVRRINSAINAVNYALTHGTE